MKKKIIYAIILILAISALYIKYSFVDFVYVFPSIETKSLPYIAKTIKKLDRALDYTIDTMNRYDYGVELVFKNAYGSGFLRRNPIPNDLDYAIGINLGKYKYDGTNADVIAESIYNKMTIFQAEFFNYIDHQSDFTSGLDMPSSLMLSNHGRAENLRTIKSSLDKVFGNKEYVIHLVREVPHPDKKLDIKIKVDYPFVLQPNEILMGNYNPIQLYTTQMKYSRTTKKVLREVTIVPDFFVEVENTKTKQIKQVEIVSESFIGQMLQLSRRFFVPIVFVGEPSAKYLGSLSYLNDDDLYLNARLFNYRRCLQDFTNLSEVKERPVKMLKRILQCAEIIAPVLDEDFKQDVYKTVAKNLNNKDVQLLNDYETALKNLMLITDIPVGYYKMDKAGELKTIPDMMRNSLEELRRRKNLDEKELEKLFVLQDEIELKMSMIKEPQEVLPFGKWIFKEEKKFTPVITTLFWQVIEDEDKIVSYISELDRPFTEAGVHKIEVSWIDKKTMGVIKNDFTAKISDLKAMAKENGMPDVQYVLVDKKDLPVGNVHNSAWIRFAQSEEEIANLRILYAKLMKDKSNFNVKRNFSSVLPVLF